MQQERWLMMKYLKRFLSLLLALALVLLPVTPAAASLLPEGEINFEGYTVIIHTNDTHARAVPNSGQNQMGFTAVSALKQYCEKANVKVILLDAGDTLHGLPFANLVEGKSIVDLMNLAGYDAMTPGNHDFNYGTDTLTKRSIEMKFPLLSANITKKSDGSDYLQKHTVIERNGKKFGIFGLSTPETAYKTNPKNVEDVIFGDPVDAAKKEVEELQALGVDVIIALAHLGVDEGSEYTSKLVAETVDGIDLIVDGHSHSTFEKGYKVKDTLIVSTGDYIQHIGVVAIDPEGNIKGAGLIDQTLFTQTDPTIDKYVESYNIKLEKLLSEVVGYTKVELDGVREHVRAVETNLGNLVTDAFRWKTGADVAFTNGGGIRASIDAGDITKNEIVTVFPFGNFIVTKKVTGDTIIKALEHGVRVYPELNGGFPQVSGITFTLDPSKPAGSRVSDVKIGGKAIDLKKEYLLATNDFVIAGGDDYTMLADIPIANEFGSMEDLIIEYLQEIGEVNLQTEGRVTVLNPAETKEEQEEPEGIKEKEGTKEIEESKDIKEVEESEKVEKKFFIYIIKKGDTLKKIARNLFGKENDWKQIYKWNIDSIANPDRIRIGQELIIYSN
jgi:5'-nucleotidase